MSQKARIAVVGTGWWATASHIPSLVQHEEAELVALCDLDAEKLAQTAQTFNVAKTYTDVETMLKKENLDGVVVTTYHATHYAVARACLEHGLHVFIEKPMTIHASDARHLVQLAEEKQRHIAMGYNHNFSNLSQRAREVLQSGTLGQMQYITSAFGQNNIHFLQGKTTKVSFGIHSPGDVYTDPERSGGGHGHLQMTHLAGLLFYITGLRVQRVHALMHNHGLNVDLVDAIAAVFAGGVLGTIGGTSNVLGGSRTFFIQVFCENGWLDFNEADGFLKIYINDQEPETVTLKERDMQTLLSSTTNNFINVILGRGENPASGLVGWRAVELLDAAYRSAASDGAAVTVEALYAEDFSR